MGEQYYSLTERPVVRVGPSEFACHECDVICELVVSPWRCLKTKCPFIYVFDDEEGAYFGCLHKVFAPELDLKAFGSQTGDVARKGDPYGAVRVSGIPRSRCPITIERAYLKFVDMVPCANPSFVREAFSVAPCVVSRRAGCGATDDGRASE